MKRSTFLLIVAILAFLFGCMMLFAPAKALEGFGLVPDPLSSFLMQLVGSFILSMGILNFRVRTHGDSLTLRSVLLFNVLAHAIGMIIDCLGIAQGIMLFAKVIPGLVVHVFVGIGSLIYMMRMKTGNS